MRLPRNLATNATREPTSTGGAVSHSTDAMFAYHRGAFAGSAAYPATSATGSGITASVSTSTSAIPDILESAHGRVHPPHPPGAISRHDRPAALSERRQACRRCRSGAPHWRPRIEETEIAGTTISSCGWGRLGTGNGDVRPLTQLAPCSSEG